MDGTQEKAALKALGEKEKEKAEFEKNKADSTPVGTARTIIIKPQLRGSSSNEIKTTAPASTAAVEIAKHKIFGFADETLLGGSKGLRRTNQQELQPTKTKWRGSERGSGEKDQGGEKGKEDESQGL